MERKGWYTLEATNDSNYRCNWYGLEEADLLKDVLQPIKNRQGQKSLGIKISLLSYNIK